MLKTVSRYALSVIYGVLIIQLSGVTNVAIAASSCQDFIRGTNYKYSAALTFFTAYNGKTYAIAKSATGATSGPASYFAMDASISGSYAAGGADNGSLKRVYLSGMYGDARPVAIDSKDTEDFIKKRFGKFLSTSDSAKSTYINAWKDYGGTGYTSLTGAPLVYPNLPAIPAGDMSPKAIAMGSDGYRAVTNGTRTSQIVEFDGKLDCATDYTPVTPPVLDCGSGQIVKDNRCVCPDGQVLLDGICQDKPPGYLSNIVCGQDLNMDGYIDPVTEMASCISTPAGNFCPIGAVDCKADSKPPICPDGTHLDPARNMCQADPVVTCGVGYIWDATVDKCVAPPTCGDSGIYSTVSKHCETLAVHACPDASYSFDPATNICTKSVVCPDGGVFSAANDRCEYPAVFTCPASFSYSSASKRCEMPPICGANSVYNKSTDRCEQVLDACPAGFLFSPELGKCTTAVTCGANGVLNVATGFCEIAAGAACESGWSFNATTGFCEQLPSCLPPGSYDTVSNLCITPISGTACGRGYSYSADRNACIAPAVCSSGNYNNITGMCEATPDCPAGSTFSLSSSRCEAAPTCPSGFTYSNVIKNCIAPITCSDGGVFSAISGKCETISSSNCPGGTTLNAGTGKCESPPSCTAPAVFDAVNFVCKVNASALVCGTGYSWDSTLNKCVANPQCPGTTTYDPVTKTCRQLASNSCPDSSYTYSSTKGRCEKAPACSVSGSTYNKTYDKCLYPMTPGCSAGYVYSVANNRCEYSPPTCPSGTTYDSPTNKCQVAAISCGPGVTRNPTTGLCDAPAGTYAATPNYSCPPGTTLSGTVCITPGGNYGATFSGGTAFTVPYGSGCIWSPGDIGGSCDPAPAIGLYMFNPPADCCTATIVGYFSPTMSGNIKYPYNGGTAFASIAPGAGLFKLETAYYNAIGGACPFGGTLIAAFCSVDTYIATASGTAGGTYTCPSGGTLSGTTCTLPPTSNPANVTYTCSQGGSPGAVTSATQTGGVAFSTPVYRTNDPVQSASYIYNTSRSGASALYGYIAGSSASWTKPVRNYLSTGKIGVDNASWPLAGYASLTDYGGWKKAYIAPSGNELEWEAYLSTGSLVANNGLYAYLSPSPGTFGGTLGCPNGFTLTGTTCYSAGVCASACPAGTTFNSSNGRCELIQPCPAGTTLDITIQMCVVSPTCNGGTFDAVLDVCWKAYNPVCPNGTTWDVTISSCYSAAVCNNGLLDTAADVCYQSSSLVCPSGQTLSDNVCVAAPTCAGGGSFSGGICTTSATITCPSGYSWDQTLGMCTQPPICQIGALNQTTHVCEIAKTVSCPTGYTLSGSTCQMTPVCPAGGSLDLVNAVCAASGGPCGKNLTLDVATNICFQTASCSAGGVMAGGFCTYAPVCPAGGTLSPADGICTSPASFTCPAGYTYSDATNLCYVTPNCNGGGLNPALDVCQKSFVATCPAGYTLNGSVCQLTPSCPAGSVYAPNIGLCDAGSKACGTGLTLDPATMTCFQSAQCLDGTLDNAADICSAIAIPDCTTASGGYVFDPVDGVCATQPQCGQGVYTPATHSCQAVVVTACGSGYTLDPATGKCSKSPVCPHDSNFQLDSSIALSPTLDMCVSDAVHTCVSGTTYTGLPVVKCEAIPVCEGSVVYNPVLHNCSANDVCPLGVQYQCMPNPAGVSQCSSNTCGDINDPNNSELTKLDENMYQDNGARDTDGTCLGQVYIFNGKPSRCRPPGLTVGVLNDCCVSDKEIIQDDMGTMISVAEDTVSTLYDIGTISYYTYQLTTGATTFAEVTEGIGNSGAVMNSMGGVFEAISAGADLVSALTEGISAYCSALVASPAVIIGVVVAVVMKVLMGGGCDKTDIQTGQGVKSKQCHFIGDYCEKKLLGACYQRARGYCCFNSKMARIIQEQGRPQLQSFQPNGAWGGPDAPNCRGLTPDEFQALDFSRIDLSEYFEDVQKDLATKIDGSQQTIMQNIQNKFQATQK